MKALLLQLTGIAGYELRLQWRRRGLVVLIAGLVLMLALGTLFFSRASQRYSFYAEGAPRPAMNQSTMSGSWAAAWLILALFLPILAAETLPLDRQYGVRELFDSLPAHPGIALAGRVLGVWAGVLAGLGGVALADALTGRLAHGPLDLGRYALLWAGSLVPLALYLSGASLLLAAPLPGRRAAALAGVLVGIFSFYGRATVLSMDITLTPSRALWPPIYLDQLGRLLSSILEADYRAQVAALGIQTQYFGPTPWENLQPLPVICALGPLQLLVPWLVAWLWLRWKETR
ncbi:MAG: hypothetical protein IT318_26470 [Anaerolineales bacterium]|nr:hypothetical protein [Anaerolineales bacterium]